MVLTELLFVAIICMLCSAYNYHVSFLLYHRRRVCWLVGWSFGFSACCGLVILSTNLQLAPSQQQHAKTNLTAVPNHPNQRQSNKPTPNQTNQAAVNSLPCNQPTNNSHQKTIAFCRQPLTNQTKQQLAPNRPGRMLACARFRNVAYVKLDEGTSMQYWII